VLLLRLSEATEDVTGPRPRPRRLPDADAEADEVLTPERSDDRGDAVVASADPPRLIRSRQRGRSSSSWTTQMRSGGRRRSRAAAATAAPLKFIIVCGCWSQSLEPGRPGRSPDPTRDFQRRLSIEIWSRLASSATHSNPTLWRVPAYSGPGLPSPTIKRSEGWSTVMRAHQGPRRMPQTVAYNVSEAPQPPAQPM
jgi:hypothetical protein